MKGHDRFQYGSIEEYQKLVEDPAFLAGILDYRGTVNSDRGRERVAVRSKHRNLLLALKARYGGSVRIDTKAGVRVIIGERTFETKNDDYVWHLSGGSKELIQAVLPYLKLNPYRRWTQVPKSA